MKPTEFLVEYRLPIHEQQTYKLWESVGHKLIEAQLTADQISQIFQQAEQGMTASGANRTMLGKGVDAAGAVNKAWKDLKDKIYNSGPMTNFAASYDKAAEKLKQATGGDQGVMKYIQKYRDFAEKHPIIQQLIYGALISAAGISGAGLGGAAVLGLFKLVDQALQGKDIRSALWSATKTGAAAYGASKLGDLIKGKMGGDQAAASVPTTQNPQAFQDYLTTKFPQAGGYEYISTGDGIKIVDAAGKQVFSGDIPLKNMDYKTFVDLTNAGKTVSPGISSGSVSLDPMAGVSDAVSRFKTDESIDLNEATIRLVFSKVELQHTKQLTEGILDTIKGAAGKAMGAVKQFGTNITTKVTADKLNSAWEKAGKPTDSAEISKILVSAGVPQEIVTSVFTSMKIPAATQAQPAAPAAQQPAAAPAAQAKPAAQPAAKPGAPAAAAQPAAKPGAAPAAPAQAPAKPGVNPELQKRLALRKAGTPAYAGNLEEELSNEGQIYSTGGGAGQSYRKFRPKIDNMVNANDGDGWHWYKPKLDEKCWDTHKQVGMKKKGNKMVPNCVPKESAIMKGITNERK